MRPKLLINFYICIYLSCLPNITVKSSIPTEKFTLSDWQKKYFPYIDALNNLDQGSSATYLLRTKAKESLHLCSTYNQVFINKPPCWNDNAFTVNQREKVNVREPSGNSIELACPYVSGSGNLTVNWWKLPRKSANKIDYEVGAKSSTSAKEPGSGTTHFGKPKILRTLPDDSIFIENKRPNSQFRVGPLAKNQPNLVKSLFSYAPRLTITAVSEDHNGIYVCEIRNPSGSNFAFFDLYFNPRPLKPTIRLESTPNFQTSTKGQKTLEVVEGQNIKLKCLVSEKTHPSASIEWYYLQENSQFKHSIVHFFGGEQIDYFSNVLGNDVDGNGGVQMAPRSTYDINQFDLFANPNFSKGKKRKISDSDNILSGPVYKNRGGPNNPNTPIILSEVHLEIVKANLNNTHNYTCHASNMVGNDTQTINIKIIPRRFWSYKHNAFTIWILIIVVGSLLVIISIFVVIQLIASRNENKKFVETEMMETRILPILDENNLPNIGEESEPIEPEQEMMHRRLQNDCYEAEMQINLFSEQMMTLRKMDRLLNGAQNSKNPEDQVLIGDDNDNDDNDPSSVPCLSSFLNHHFLDHRWEIPRDKIQILQKLGQGNFGMVYKAKISEIEGPNSYTIAALKTLKRDANHQAISDLFEEIKTLKKVSNPRHSCIINLIGVCTQNGPIQVILEYAENGNLRDFLRNYQTFYLDEQQSSNSFENKQLQQTGDNYYSDSGSTSPLTNQDLHQKIIRMDSGQKKTNYTYFQVNKLKLTDAHLLEFSYQISQGMYYLHEKQVLHRDLAARNILLEHNLSVKIADFGLARDLAQNQEGKDYYRKTTPARLPWKWMSPEANKNHIFSTANDVWSYGVVLYEIFSIGGVPFPNVNYEEFLKYLESGERMARPRNCDEGVYQIMMNCWSEEAKRRPGFLILTRDMKKILKQCKRPKRIII